jgi:2,3-bisphosphoglycerate-dependent phosphoglycerate mutase
MLLLILFLFFIVTSFFEFAHSFITNRRSITSHLFDGNQISLIEDDGYSISNKKKNRLVRWWKENFRVKKPGSLILVRHGETVLNYNKTFTGWIDTDLSERGFKEIEHAASLLLERGYSVDVVYTSRLKRAIRSSWILLIKLNQLYKPVYKSWRLNERMYGDLEGKSKQHIAVELGEEIVQAFRAGLKGKPPPMQSTHPHWHHTERKYSDLQSHEIPITESLEDTMSRTIPLWNNRIVPSLKAGQNVLIVAHANSLRGIVKHIDQLSEDEIEKVAIPNAIPLVYKFDNKLQPIKLSPSSSLLSGEFLEKKGLLRAALEKEKELRQRIPGLSDMMIPKKAMSNNNNNNNASSSYIMNMNATTTAVMALPSNNEQQPQSSSLESSLLSLSSSSISPIRDNNNNNYNDSEVSMDLASSSSPSFTVLPHSNRNHTSYSSSSSSYHHLDLISSSTSSVTPLTFWKVDSPEEENQKEQQQQQQQQQQEKQTSTTTSWQMPPYRSHTQFDNILEGLTELNQNRQWFSLAQNDSINDSNEQGSGSISNQNQQMISSSTSKLQIIGKWWKSFFQTFKDFFKQLLQRINQQIALIRKSIFSSPSPSLPFQQSSISSSSSNGMSKNGVLTTVEPVSTTSSSSSGLSYMPLQNLSKASSSSSEEQPKQFIVIIRHGKTEYNTLGIFTGWEDAPLNEQGRQEARQAGNLLKLHQIEFDAVYTSWLSRAIETAWIILDELDALWLPIMKSWRLNERMYVYLIIILFCSIDD